MPPTTPLHRRLLVLLMAAHAALALHAVWRSSVTIDEYAHVPAGLSYWETGSFGLYHHNPPLAKLLASLPVLAARPEVDYSGSWARAAGQGEPPGHVEFAADFMRANAARYFDLFRLARLPIVALSLLGLWLLWRWGCELWGERGGLLAAALWAFEPNLVAHAGLATTDMAATVLVLASLDTLRRCLVRPSAGRAALAGLAAGLALLTKFTALVLLPAGALLVLLAMARSPEDRSRSDRSTDRPASRRPLLLIPIVALLVLNLGYLFEGTGRRLGTFPFLSPALTRPRTGGVVPHREARFYQMLFEQRQNRFEGTWPGALPVPLPAEYLLGLDEQAFEASPGLPGGGYPIYLRGVMRRGEGWWWYDVYALLVKLPLAVWALGLCAAAAAFRLTAARGRRLEEAMWIVPASTLLLVMSAATGLDIGVRYLLPIVPLAFLGVARLAHAGVLARLGRIGRGGIAAALAWMAAGTLWVHPHELSYFNEAAGGPARGGRHLLDSNIDWGQDLLELRRLLDRTPGAYSGATGLAYFGAVDPVLAGIPYFVPPRDPRVVPAGRVVDSDRESLRPGLYAVSVNFVHGLPHRVLAPDGRWLASDADAFAYFRVLRPVARAGYSILLYRIGTEEVERVRAEWAKPLRRPGGASGRRGE